jgi:hypothetical protein
MADKRNRFKELLDWAHHAYWIGALLISSGVAEGVMKWTVSHVTVLSQFGGAIWLLIAGLLMYFLSALRPIWLRRKPALISQNAAALVINPTNTGLPSDVNIKEFFRLAYRTPLEAEVRKNFYLLARQEQPNDPERFYLDFIGVGLVSVIYNDIWWPMYKSQLLALQEVNRRNGLLPVSEAKRHYEDALREYAQEYARTPTAFEQWLQYLSANGLVLRHPSEMLEITERGKDFLKYLTHWGRGADLKRL